MTLTAKQVSSQLTQEIGLDDRFVYGHVRFDPHHPYIVSTDTAHKGKDVVANKLFMLHRI